MYSKNVNQAILAELNKATKDLKKNQRLGKFKKIKQARIRKLIRYQNIGMFGYCSRGGRYHI